MKPVLISGIQPSGELHIGNYLGALKNFVDLQNSEKYECYFFIADYHSLTESASWQIDPETKQKQILDLAKIYLATGLDPKKSTIFVQSQVPQTTELAWILSTLTPFGELSRMTQFKEKGEGKESVNVGLFTYPILMTADVLLYGAEFIPIGDDQLQHLEFIRTLVRKFNSRFGETFKEPKPLLTKTPRIMSFHNPDKKMSKSEPQGCLFLLDKPDVIKLKIKEAVTDSEKEIKFNETQKPAISNLLKIYSAFSDKNIETLEKEFKNKTYTEFKESLSETIIKALKPIHDQNQKIKDGDIKTALENGKEQASKIASAKITQIKEKIGLKI